MKYFAPERLRLPNGLPMYMDELGPIAALPRINIEPAFECENEVILSVMLLDDPTTGSWYECQVDIDKLPQILRNWDNDPEEVLRSIFQYPGMAREAKSKPVFTLEDIGL